MDISTDRAQGGGRTRQWRAILDNWRRAIEQRPLTAASIVGAISLAFGAVRIFHRATTPWSVLPDHDYWGNIRGLITEQGLTLDLWNLLRHNNEHIVLIPKLIYAANYLLTSGNNVGLLVYSILAGAACAIFLVLFAKELLLETPARWVLCAFLFPLAMFSAKLSHSYYFGMSGTIWLTADLFVILSAAAMAKAAYTGSMVWLLASLLAAVLGVLSYSTAIYSLVVLLLFCSIFLVVPKFRGRFPWPVLVGVAATTLVVLTIFLYYRPHPKGHPPLDFDPVGLAAFVLSYMGSALAEGYLPPFIGLTIFVAAALAIRRLLAEGRPILLWVTLFLFAPFNGLMTGIGRLGFGMKAALSSRYQSVTVISIIALIVLVLAALPKDSSRRSIRVRSVGIAALLIAAVFLVTNSKTIKTYAKRLERKPVAEIAMRLELAGDQHIQAATKAVEQFHLVLPALRASRHVPFNASSPCEKVLGQVLSVPSNVTAGSIDSMTAYTVSKQDKPAVELSGWALEGRNPADCIAIVDGAGKVIGAGTSTYMLPHPITQRPARIGWKGVASFPQSLPVCAFALFSDEWLPLANCQVEIAATN